MANEKENLIQEIEQNYTPRYSGRVYSKYSPAFITTNEDVFGTYQAINPKDKSVLTVCASGMHAIYAYMMGAKAVTSFDISYCAEYIMKLHIAAIKSMPHWKYARFINQAFKRLSVPLNKNFQDIRANLDDDAKLFFDTMKDKKFIQNDLFNEPNVPIKSDFLKMRKTTPGAIKFLQTDISDLYKKIDCKYDIIHLSNIFGYLHDDNEKAEIVYNLSEHMNSGGTMVVQYAYGNKPRAENAARELQNALPWLSFETIELSGGIVPQYLAIMHKVRS
ncbi:MAG: hypothetical protein LBK26_03505 [Rickettsiales bacterium]|jgi:hypothetical protein|nr:hypothetical protein [Rickettsiales bacterium]